MNLQAKGEHVLLEIITKADRIAAETQKRSGIFLASEKMIQGEPDMGRVFSIGDKVPAAHQYKIGDVVIYHTKEMFQGFEYEGKRLTSMLHSEIMAIVSGAEL